MIIACVSNILMVWKIVKKCVKTKIFFLKNLLVYLTLFRDKYSFKSWLVSFQAVGMGPLKISDIWIKNDDFSMPILVLTNQIANWASAENYIMYINFVAAL